MSAATTVFLKEVTENLRDRKTVFNALVMGPLLGPVFFVMMMSYMITRELSNAEKPLDVPVVGRFHHGVGIFHADDVLDSRPIRVRFRWTHTDTPNPQWEQAFSGDGGATWEVNWTMRFERTMPDAGGAH